MDIARLPFVKFDMVLVVVVADATETLYSERFKEILINEIPRDSFMVKMYTKVEFVVHFEKKN